MTRTISHHHPTVEWTPLNEIAATWATFGIQTTNQQGLDAVSAAFAALRQETAARQIYAEADGDEQQILLALDALHEAADHWNTALFTLAAYRERPHPEDVEFVEAQVLSAVCQSGYRHYLLVARLAVRLVQELSTLVGIPARVMVGTLNGKEGTR